MMAIIALYLIMGKYLTSDNLTGAVINYYAAIRFYHSKYSLKVKLKVTGLLLKSPFCMKDEEQFIQISLSIEIPIYISPLNSPCNPPGMRNFSECLLK